MISKQKSSGIFTPIHIVVVGHCVWAQDEKVRVYFDLESNQDLPVNAFYEVVQGDSPDQLIKRGERVFAVEFKAGRHGPLDKKDVLGAFEELASYLSTQSIYAGESKWQTKCGLFEAHY